jgi:predicted DNA-binding transcriptional regulator AlpA
MLRHLLTAHQVAELLALGGPRSFAQRRRRLEGLGFPPPVPGLGRRWDPAAIAAWLAAKRGAAAEAGNDNVEQLLIGRARAIGAD